jgi:hypothetical protein
MYIDIQSDKEYNNKTLIDPICPIFIDDIENTTTFCSSIAFLQDNYTTRLEKLKEDQTTKIIKVIEDLYKIDNFTKTKEVLFLLYKSENKLRVLDILNNFDNIKNEFYSLDKQKIQCN